MVPLLSMLSRRNTLCLKSPTRSTSKVRLIYPLLRLFLISVKLFDHNRFITKRKDRSSNDPTCHNNSSNLSLSPPISSSSMVPSFVHFSTHSINYLRCLFLPRNICNQARPRLKHPPHHRHLWIQQLPSYSSSGRVQRRRLDRLSYRG